MSMPQSIARSELILGGQKSGKSRRAELLARQWLQAAPAHRALLLARLLGVPALLPGLGNLAPEHADSGSGSCVHRFVQSLRRETGPLAP